MKNIRLTTLAVLTAAAIAGSAYAADGTFRGTAMGHNDEVIVDVTIEKDRITEIKIVQTFETPAVAEKPLAWIPETGLFPKTGRTFDCELIFTVFGNAYFLVGSPSREPS